MPSPDMRGSSVEVYFPKLTYKNQYFGKEPQGHLPSDETLLFSSWTFLSMFCC